MLSCMWCDGRTLPVLLLALLGATAQAQVTDTTVLAVNMNRSGNYGTVPSPSGSAAQLLSDGDSVSSVFTLQEKPPYLLHFTAAGEFGQGWPHTALSVDGNAAAYPVEVGSSTFDDHYFVIRPQSGQTLSGDHVITLSFPDDYDMPDGDRNLDIDTVSVTGTALLATSGVPLSLDATAMESAYGAGVYVPDVSNPLWEMLSNGYVEHTLSFPAAQTYDVTVLVKAEGSGATWPQVQLSVDGVEGDILEVNDTLLSPLTFQQTLSAGAHTLRLSYINDDPAAQDPLLAPNLFLGQLTVQAHESAPQAGDAGAPQGSTHTASFPHERLGVGFGCDQAPGPLTLWPLLLALASVRTLRSHRAE